MKKILLIGLAVLAAVLAHDVLGAETTHPGDTRRHRAQAVNASALSAAPAPRPDADGTSQNQSPAFPEEIESADLMKLIPLHQIKTAPGPYDWLATHPEPGQDFDDYISSSPVSPDAERKCIYIVLLGDFDSVRKTIIEKTARFIQAYYTLPVRFLPPIPMSVIPPEARRVHPQTRDKQILTTYVLESLLKPLAPEDAFCLIAFTSSDLWPGEGWNFVFGQASLPDRLGVWSVYRNGDPHESDEMYRLCLLRSIKTGVHEIGHMFSMHHCIYFECNMNGSNHRQESDSRPVWLCPVCLRKLLWAVHENPVERYKNLVEICEEFGLMAEKKFFERSIELLTSP